MIIQSSSEINSPYTLVSNLSPFNISHQQIKTSN